MEKSNKWKKTKINDGFEMTRRSLINNQAIECRKLNWFEKIIYWKRTRQLNLFKFEKEE